MGEKCILILASYNDVSVDDVLHWLFYYNKFKIIRINNNDNVKFVNISISSSYTTFTLLINDKILVKSEDIFSYWYRRGRINYNPVKTSGKLFNLIDIGFNINKYYNNEFEHIENYLHYLLKKIIPIQVNSFFDIHTNKLTNLEIAKRCHLNIPNSIISNDIEEVKHFISQNKKTIVKPIRYPGFYLHASDFEISYDQQTNLIDKSLLLEICDKYDSFQPTLFQEYIEKDFEIRSFLLQDKLYSMAIFSQQNEKTKIDFRNYDKINPNRNIPFKLPIEIENKIINFSKEIDINCGSFDIIFSKGAYYFLEVNPVGQFQWLSHNCNYYIEREIAQTLMGYER